MDCIMDLISQQSTEFEIIVVDNASTDGSVKFLRSLGDKIKVIYNASNKGCAFSWNQGIKASKNTWKVILNNDTRIPKNCFENLLHFAKSKKFGVVSPGMREGPLNYNFNEYGNEFSKSMRNALRFGIANGACFAVHSSVFERIGLFDENFTIGQYEDADFFRRCITNGIKIATTGTSFIHHFGSITQNQVLKDVDFDYGKKNQIYHRRKWKIGFFKRHAERYRTQIKLKYWSSKEYYKYKHSLIEKYKDGKITYT
jgi:N-acetylglucosaminyl-diphospho-decaprenol L-rhamnosyltransferase